MSFLHAEKCSFPLDKKYMASISCGQGLREAIEAEEAGGISTSGLWHNGIDFMCPDRTPVYAAKSGVVICCYPSFYNGQKWRGHSVYGGLVIIEHYDGTYTLYAHLSFTEIREGDFVYRGEQIGLSGGVRGRRGSGISTGPHLHFAMYMKLSEAFDFGDEEN